MEAVIRFASGLRGWPVAVAFGLAAAGGCAQHVCELGSAGNPLPSNPSQTADPQAVPAKAAPTARPQAPAEPQTPSGPVAPPKVDPTAVSWTPAAPAPAAAVVPAGGPTPDQGTPQVRVVAQVGSDVFITDDEVWQMVRQRAGEYVKLVGTERDAREKELFREELRRLIERELIIAELVSKLKKNKPQMMAELKDQVQREAAHRLREFKRVNKFPSDDIFVQALQAQGLTVKGLQRQLERNAMMNIYLGQMLKEKGGKGASLATVQQYYEDHPDEFKVEDRVKWQDLFVAYSRFNTTVEARQYAEGVLRQARGEADFAGLVKQYGHGDSALRGGEGIGEKPGEISPKELEPTVLKLTAGQLSGVIATETGFHVVKVVEREEAGTRPFDEKTQTYIRAKLAALAHKVEYERMIDDLWRKSIVKVIHLP